MPVELQIAEMTVEEKLRAMEALWDDLCRREESVPVPHWHKDLLDERERLIEQGKARFIDLETAKKRISEGLPQNNIYFSDCEFREGDRD